MRCPFRTALLFSLLTYAFLPAATAPPSVDADAQFLKSMGMEVEPAQLLEFFRARSLKDPDRDALDRLIAKLGDQAFSTRESAGKELVARGPAALPALREVLKKSPSLEVARRAEDCVKKIEKTLNPDLVVAAARVLTGKQVPGALQVLLDYLPHIQDAWIEEEVLLSIGVLGLRDGGIDPVLDRALKSKDSASRSAAGYVVAQRGDMDQREAVRQLLTDADPKVAQRVVQGLVGRRQMQTLRDLIPGDENFLRTHNVGTDEASLLDFLRKRTLSGEDQQQLKNAIRKLGDPVFSVRNQASRELVKQGTPALIFLRAAVEDRDAEIARRVRLCIDEINRGPGAALPAAVVRLLARPVENKGSPAPALRVLLGYVPFADDDTVEEEVLNALCLLSTRDVKVDPLLTAALHDPLPTRRGAAAYVLGKVGTKEHHAGVRKLLDDPLAGVRLRTAQGLLAGKDKDAVPALIQLLSELPTTNVWQVEEQLFRLAAGKGPMDTLGDGTTAQKAKVVKSWNQWWQASASSIDLARAAEGDFHLGLLTVCEYDSAVGQAGGQVWEAGREGKPRWKIAGLLGAMDAQVLPNGRVLIAENSARRLTERDVSGDIKWQYQVEGNPIACQRLPNGNTFLATYNQVMEIGPGQKVIYNHNRGPGFYIFSAQKTRAGHIVCMSAQGNILELDAITGKEIRNINLGPHGGWCSAEALPNGRYLVATMNNGQVREIDAAGKTHWTIAYQGVFRATRLPNGNTIVASMTSRKIAEFDRAGVMRWEKVCDGRPWSVRYR